MDPAAWAVSGPRCGDWTIKHVIGDAASGMIWAGGDHWDEIARHLPTILGVEVLDRE
jgi:hypothetical protein